MLLEPPTPEQLADIYSDLGLTPESIERDVEYLKEWISKQPHLPDGIDERLLKNLLVFRKNRIEKVKESIDLFYSVKHYTPDMFDGYDPLNPDMQVTLENIVFCFLPKLTPEGSRVCLFRILDGNPSLFNFTKVAQLCIMISSITTIEDICRDTVIVIDLRGVVLGHLATITVPLVKQYLFIIQKVFAIRQKAVHLIFAPSYVDTLFSIFKPFIKKKLIERIHFHSGGYGDMFDHLPQSIFPLEYGGDGQSLKSLQDSWKTKVLDFRGKFIEYLNMQSDESKRQGEPVGCDTIFGLQGSFRQLSVD